MSSRAAKFRRHLSKVCLDIRRLGTARVYDQKVAPDVTTTIADVVSRIAAGERAFTVGNVWDSDEFKQSVTGVFTKPDPKNPGVRREYDKFIGQPLLALSHARVLRKEPGVPRQFRVANWPILKDIAHGELAAVDFLAEYAEKILLDSGLGEESARFFQKQDEQSLDQLGNAYAALLLKYTGVRGEKEIGRIFPKIVNVVAFKKQSRGRIGGRLSLGRITLYDIRYNRPNWRDVGKSKTTPRTERVLDGEWDAKPLIRGAMRAVKEHHQQRPEIEDSLSRGGVQAHHIFPRSQHPGEAARLENIILLTPAQHSTFAHPSGTGSISKGYQLFCLLRKLEAVVKCESEPDCNFYSMVGFIDMLAQCGALGVKERKVLTHKSAFPVDNSNQKVELVRQVADDVRRFLIERYVGG